MAAYRIEFKPAAERQFYKFSQSVQKLIKPHIDALAHNPRPAGCGRLTGKDGLWRIRVGDYRIVYEIQDNVLVVMVVRLGHRREVYRGQR